MKNALLKLWAKLRDVPVEQGGNAALYLAYIFQLLKTARKMLMGGAREDHTPYHKRTMVSQAASSSNMSRCDLPIWQFLFTKRVSEKSTFATN